MSECQCHTDVVQKKVAMQHLIKLSDYSMQQMAKSMIKYSGVESLHFSRIETDEAWEKLGKFRHESYQIKRPYMIGELYVDGKDAFDDHGFVYAAWIKDEIAASVRLCPSPFEVKSFIQAQKLVDFLGELYQKNYLEWTRLLIHPNTKIPKLMSALIVYAGLQILMTTSYRHYVGYSIPLVKRLFSAFKIQTADFTFKIPHRGKHHYQLFKGNFAEDFNLLLRTKFPMQCIANNLLLANPDKGHDHV